MKLSDPVSMLLNQRSTYDLIFPPDPIDPSYFIDLKEHLQKNPDYRKERIEWRKTKPLTWDLWRVKEEYFNVFCENSLPTFHEDVERFLTINPKLELPDAAQKFCEKWKGYNKTYGVELVERAMRRCSKY